MFKDMLIGDGVIHAYNNHPSNAHGEIGKGVIEETYQFATFVNPPEAVHSREQWRHDFSASAIEQALFLESDVDFGVYHSLPIFDYFEDGWSSLSKGVEIRDRNHERVKLLGCVDPLTDDPTAEMRRQVEERDVDGFKTYPTFYDEGKIRPLRLDDELLPIVETAHSLGVDHIGAHKVLPLGPVGMHHLNVDDVADIASMYPDMQFELLHPDLAFIHETASMLGSHPNVWVNLELTLGYLFLHPDRLAEILGELLMWGGPDQILFGTGLPLVHPQSHIEAFWDVEIPEELGYPPLTDEVKRKILGENLLELHDWDVDELRKQVESDTWAKRREADGRPAPWSGVTVDGMEATD